MTEFGSLAIAVALNTCAHHCHQATAWLDVVPSLANMVNVLLLLERRIHDHLVVQLVLIQLREVVADQVVTLFGQDLAQSIVALDGVHLGAGLFGGIGDIAFPGGRFQYLIAWLDVCGRHNAVQRFALGVEVARDLVANQPALQLLQSALLFAWHLDGVQLLDGRDQLIAVVDTHPAQAVNRGHS